LARGIKVERTSLERELAGSYSEERCPAKEFLLFSWLPCVTNFHLFWD